MADLGRIAYEAYGDERSWTVFDGGAMPAWEEQSQAIRAAWEAAAQAVALAVIRRGPVRAEP